MSATIPRGRTRKRWRTDPAGRSRRRSRTFSLRTPADPLGLTKPAERELAAVDAGLALQRTLGLRELVGQGLAGRRIPVLLMAVFGALALLLASVGIYAMFDSVASTREREFGIRMALGSRPREIAQLVLGQAARWVAAGLLGGAFGIIIVMRLLRELLFGVQPSDPLAIGAAVGILIGCAAIAVFVPVRRATRADPAITLRAQ